jgi:hypothetical protein
LSDVILEVIDQFALTSVFNKWRYFALLNNIQSFILTHALDVENTLTSTSTQYLDSLQFTLSPRLVSKSFILFCCIFHISVCETPHDAFDRVWLMLERNVHLTRIYDNTQRPNTEHFVQIYMVIRLWHSWVSEHNPRDLAVTLSAWSRLTIDRNVICVFPLILQNDTPCWHKTLQV